MATYYWLPEKNEAVPTEGPAFLMHDDPSGRAQMFHIGIPELAIIEWARRFCDKSKTFIDCGAHMGSYSIMLADGFKYVEAIEAQRRTYYQLCGNIFANEKYNIHPHNAAITSHQEANDEVTLSIVSEDGGGSTICETHEKVLKTEIVRTKSIDGLLPTNVGLIKLDIEGNELKALKGADWTIKRDKPPIIFESNNTPEFPERRTELFKYLQTINYSISEIRPFENMYFAEFNQ